MSKKFFIIGGYTYSNPGDEAILKTTVARLNRLYPRSHFVICSDKKDFSARFSSDISSEYFFYRCPRIFYKYRLFQRLYRLLFPLSCEAVRFVARDRKKMVDKMRGCDMILFIGGGYLNSLYNLLQMHYLYRLSVESGRLICLLGQTLGPFTRMRDRAIAQSIFRGAAHIVLREESSRLEIGIFSEKAAVGGDDALAFHDCLKPGDEEAIAGYFKRSDKKQLILGLNLRPAALPQGFYAKLAQDLDRFNRDVVGGKLKVVFVPMETSVYCDDRSEAEKLGQIKDRNFEYSVITKPLTVENRLAAISKTDIFLGMRFHSLVFAISSGVPCLGLYLSDYYNRKNRGLLEMYGMQRYCLQISPSLDIFAPLGELYRDNAKIREGLKERHAAVLRKQAALYESIFKV